MDPFLALALEIESLHQCGGALHFRAGTIRHETAVHIGMHPYPFALVGEG
jgi:hypothetical protein